MQTSSTSWYCTHTAKRFSNDANRDIDDNAKHDIDNMDVKLDIDNDDNNGAKRDDDNNDNGAKRDMANNDGINNDDHRFLIVMPSVTSLNPTRRNT